MKSNQRVKLFKTDTKNPIDSQINEYLISNPGLKIIQITFASTCKLYEKDALVLFEKIDSDQETESTKLIINEAKEQLFESVAAYLEKPDKFRELKDCWLFNGRSDDLRRLLTEALRNS